MTTTDLGVVKPVNKGNHVIANTYETLNMVQSGGKIYMANKDVPANTELTNLEFWVNMSGDGLTLEQLQLYAMSVISTLNKIVTEQELNPIKMDISELNAEIIALTTEVDEKIEANNYATDTIGGTIKMRVSGTTLYLTNNGTDA